MLKKSCIVRQPIGIILPSSSGQEQIIYRTGIALNIHCSLPIRGCQIGMQESQLCREPCHFCKLDMATSRIAFLDLNRHAFNFPLQIHIIDGALYLVQNFISDVHPLVHSP